MNAPRAVTTKTATRPVAAGAGRGGAVGSVTGRTLAAVHCMMQLTRTGAMERKSFSEMDCSVAQCLEVGRGVVEPAHRPRRVPRGHDGSTTSSGSLGISRNVLHQRLDAPRRRRGAREGAVLRAPAALRVPPHRQGTRPVARARPRCASGATATRRRTGRRIELVHRAAGATTDVELRRARACGEPVAARDVVARDGPGRAHRGSRSRDAVAARGGVEAASSVRLGDRHRLDHDALGRACPSRADRVDRRDDVEPAHDLAEQRVLGRQRRRPGDPR